MSIKITWKILDIVTQKNWFAIFKLLPDEETKKVLPVWALNDIGTYISCKWSAIDLQKWVLISMFGSFQTNTYKPTNVFAQKSVPKLNFVFKELDILEWVNSETWLKDFFIKEIPFVWPKLADAIFKTYSADQLTELLSLDRPVAKQKLTVVSWLWSKIADSIIDNWILLADRRDVLANLFKYWISASKAMKIYDVFWKDAVRRIEDNPYCLTRVKWIWFKQAEDLAITQFNIPKDSINRYTALIEHHIREICEADTLFSIWDLKSRIKDYLINDNFEYKDSIDQIIEKWLASNIEQNNVVKINDSIYMLSSYYNLEKKIAEKLLSMKEAVNPLKIDEKSVEWYDFLTSEQKDAVVNILTKKLSILNGAAGTGKTTTTKVVVNALVKSGYSYVLISPTNKAVKRIKEVNMKIMPNGERTTVEAYTIHSLLWLRAWSTTPKFNSYNPLPYDYVLIDESSMMWEKNASLILEAIWPKTSIVFMGDKNQLSSVDSWSFFNDICEPEAFKQNTKTLSVVKRTVTEWDWDVNIWFWEITHWMNNLVANSQRILNTSAPISTNSNTFCKYYQEDNYPGIEDGKDYKTAIKEDIILSLKKLYDKMIDKGLDINKDYQILVPVYKGDLWIDNLNSIFSDYLNWHSKKIDIDWHNFRVGDKVYYDNKNDEFWLVKWDTWHITKIDAEGKTVSIFFYSLDKECCLKFNELDNINLWYAMSIHKSQWSEFDYCSLIITNSAYSLLNNNILYTWYTRWKKKTFLFGEKTAITIALNNKESARNTYLFNILSKIDDSEIEITKSRELKWISDNQIKFVENKLNEHFDGEWKIIKIKPLTSNLAGFKFIFADKAWFQENEFFDKMEIDNDQYEKLKYDKNVKFLRLTNGNAEPNWFYKAKLSNHFNHMLISLDSDNKMKIHTKKNSIKNVFS